MINPSNDFGFFNADIVVQFLYMLDKGGCVGTTVSNVNNIFINPLFNRPTCFSNVRDTIGAGKKVESFHVIGINRVLNRSKKIFNGNERFERRGDINLLKNMESPIRGSLDI